MCRQFHFSLPLMGVSLLFLWSCTIEKPHKPVWHILPPIEAKATVDLIWQGNIGRQGRRDIEALQWSHYRGYHGFATAQSQQLVIWQLGSPSVEEPDVYSGIQPLVQLETKDEVLTGPYWQQGHLYYGTSEGDLVSYDPNTQQELWRRTLRSELASHMAFNQQAVFIRTQDGRLLAIEQKSGDTIWAQKTELPKLFVRTFSPVTLDNGIVYVGWPSGEVAAFDAETGVRIWGKQLAMPRGRTDLERMVDVHAPLLVKKGRIYALMNQRQLTVLDQDDGDVLWAEDDYGYLPLFWAQDQVIVINDQGRIKSLSPNTGQVIWQHNDLQDRLLQAATANDRLLVVADELGWLHVVDVITGQRLFSRAHVQQPNGEGSGIKQVHLLAGNQLQVLDDDGDLSLYQIQYAR